MKKAIKGNHTYLLLLLFFSLSSSAKAQTSPPQNSQNPYMQTNFNPSMAIVIVVLISAFFFLGFFSIYIRQCAGDRPGADSAARPAAAVRRQRGLTPAAIQTLPTMLYSEAKEHKHGKGALECAVCLSEFEDDETLRLLPKCSHVFHTDCIDAWLSGHVTCPVCRDNLSDTKGNVNIQPIELEREVISAQEDETRHDHVVINIIQDHESAQEEERRREEIIELERIGSTRRAMRSKSTRRPPRFPRSHSTGHSLSVANTSGADRDFDRYTLRLPEPVLRSIIAAGKLKRTASLIEFHTTGEGSNRGTREESSNRGGRSVRSLVRNFSEKLGNWGIGRRGGENGEGSIKKGEGEGSTNRGRFVRVQFDCLPGSGGGAATGDKAEHGAA